MAEARTQGVRRDRAVLADGASETLRLLVSELVTNAVKPRRQHASRRALRPLELRGPDRGLRPRRGLHAGAPGRCADDPGGFGLTSSASWRIAGASRPTTAPPSGSSCGVPERSAVASRRRARRPRTLEGHGGRRPPRGPCCSSSTVSWTSPPRPSSSRCCSASAAKGTRSRSTSARSRSWIAAIEPAGWCHDREPIACPKSARLEHHAKRAISSAIWRCSSRPSAC